MDAILHRAHIVDAQPPGHVQPPDIALGVLNLALHGKVARARAPLAMARAAIPGVLDLAPGKDPTLLAAQADQKTAARDGHRRQAHGQRRRAIGHAHLHARVDNRLVGQVVVLHQRQLGGAEGLRQFAQRVAGAHGVVVVTAARRTHALGRAAAALLLAGHNQPVAHGNEVRVGDAVGGHQIAQLDADASGNLAEAVAGRHHILLVVGHHAQFAVGGGQKQRAAGAQAVVGREVVEAAQRVHVEAQTQRNALG